MIIGINGKIGSGKDTVGKIIQYLQCHNTGEITIQDVMSNPEHEWWLEEQSKFEIKKFAGKLKEVASLLTGIDVEDFEDQEFKKSYLGSEWGTVRPNPLNAIPVFEDAQFNELMSVREFLQKLGTEAMREGLHTNVWVNALFADYKPPKMSQYNPSNWIITDMRFPNELEAVVERKGITIRVVRPGTTTGTHASETALDDAYFDHVISNNGTIEDLVEKVKQILTIERII
jgi:ABC-type oligopeptide transport system ATPase subunit